MTRSVEALAPAVVVDAGGRYGIHPSWAGYGGELLYFSFEPDREEAERLRRANHSASVEVVEAALDKETGQRLLHITRHRGYCSFLEPDLESDWFKRYRPGEGKVVSTMMVNTLSVDDFAASKGVAVDFLKLDTEGTELEILLGAKTQMIQSILGVRAEVDFSPLYKNQALFPEIHNHLLARNFFLVNLAYAGRGVPRIGLVGNPDMLSPDYEQYGTLIGTEAVWARRYDWVLANRGEDNRALALATLKYAYFCLLNRAPDIALDTLLTFSRAWNVCDSGVANTRIYHSLRLACVRYLGRWRVNPTDAKWELARSICREIFGLDLEAGHKYWELVQSLE